MHGLAFMAVGTLMVVLSICLSRDIENTFIHTHEEHDGGHIKQHKLGICALIAFSGLSLASMGMWAMWLY